MKRKLLSLVLVFVMVFALSVPALADSAGFVSGTVIATDKNGYDSFDGREITANNSTTVFNNFSFIADNKTLNAWYIHITDDISGTLEVAYKVGGSYYIVTFDIEGAGNYRIADSKGSNGANMVKIGELKEKTDNEPVSFFRIIYQPFSNSPYSMPMDEYSALMEELLDEGITPLYLSNGWVQYDHEVFYDLYADEYVNFEVETYYEFEYKGIRYAIELDVVQLEIWNPVIGAGRLFYEGEINKDYTSVIDNISRNINVGASFTVDKVDGYDDYYYYEAFVHSSIIKLGPVIEIEPNLSVTYEWKDLYGLDKAFADSKIISFSPALGEHVLAVGTIIDDIKVVLAEEWINGEGKRCNVELGVITIDGVDYHNKIDDLENLSLTIEEGVNHSIHFLLAVAIED